MITLDVDVEAEGWDVIPDLLVPDHAAHLVVHGVLHLLGLDHETEAEAEAMEAVEVAALARLGIADPYGATA